MSKISDSEHEARLLQESKAASEKKRKLEEDIRIADARNNLLLESAAQKDIEAYKQRSLVPMLGPLRRRKWPKCQDDFWITVSHPTPQSRDLPIIAYCVFAVTLERLAIDRRRKRAPEIRYGRMRKVFR